MGIGHGDGNGNVNGGECGGESEGGIEATGINGSSGGNFGGGDAAALAQLLGMKNGAQLANIPPPTQKLLINALLAMKTAWQQGGEGRPEPGALVQALHEVDTLSLQLQQCKETNLQDSCTISQLKQQLYTSRDECTQAQTECTQARKECSLLAQQLASKDTRLLRCIEEHETWKQEKLQLISQQSTKITQLHTLHRQAAEKAKEAAALQEQLRSLQERLIASEGKFQSQLQHQQSTIDMLEEGLEASNAHQASLEALCGQLESSLETLQDRHAALSREHQEMLAQKDAAIDELGKDIGTLKRIVLESNGGHDGRSGLSLEGTVIAPTYAHYQQCKEELAETNKQLHYLQQTLYDTLQARQREPVNEDDEFKDALDANGDGGDKEDEQDKSNLQTLLNEERTANQQAQARLKESEQLVKDLGRQCRVLLCELEGIPYSDEEEEEEDEEEGAESTHFITYKNIQQLQSNNAKLLRAIKARPATQSSHANGDNDGKVQELERECARLNAYIESLLEQRSAHLTNEHDHGKTAIDSDVIILDDDNDNEDDGDGDGDGEDVADTNYSQRSQHDAGNVVCTQCSQTKEHLQTLLEQTRQQSSQLTNLQSQLESTHAALAQTKNSLEGTALQNNTLQIKLEVRLEECNRLNAQLSDLMAESGKAKDALAASKECQASLQLALDKQCIHNESLKNALGEAKNAADAKINWMQSRQEEREAMFKEQLLEYKVMLMHMNRVDGSGDSNAAVSAAPSSASVGVEHIEQCSECIEWANKVSRLSTEIQNMQEHSSNTLAEHKEQLESLQRQHARSLESKDHEITALITKQSNLDAQLAKLQNTLLQYEGNVEDTEEGGGSNDVLRKQISGLQWKLDKCQLALSTTQQCLNQQIQSSNTKSNDEQSVNNAEWQRKMTIEYDALWTEKSRVEAALMAECSRLKAELAAASAAKSGDTAEDAKNRFVGINHASADDENGKTRLLVEELEMVKKESQAWKSKFNHLISTATCTNSKHTTLFARCKQLLMQHTQQTQRIAILESSLRESCKRLDKYILVAKMGVDIKRLYFEQCERVRALESLQKNCQNESDQDDMIVEDDKKYTSTADKMGANAECDGSTVEVAKEKDKDQEFMLVDDKDNSTVEIEPSILVNGDVSNCTADSTQIEEGHISSKLHDDQSKETDKEDVLSNDFNDQSKTVFVDGKGIDEGAKEAFAKENTTDEDEQMFAGLG